MFSLDKSRKLEHVKPLQKVQYLVTVYNKIIPLCSLNRLMSTSASTLQDGTMPSLWMKETKIPPKHKCCFSWTKLFLSALFPLIFGIFTIVFTVQQDSIARANREQDQSQIDVLRKQTVYDSYIDTISKLFLRRNFNRSDVNTLEDIRVKTLNALRQLDTERKREIIQFLYENKLIRYNKSKIEELVRLDEGDLSGIQFVYSSTLICKFTHLYLPFVLAAKITFDRCQLQDAQFDGASMVEANFTQSILSYAKFIKTNLTSAVFDKNNMRSVNFTGAILTHARFHRSKLENVDFTNADLLGSDLEHDQLTNLFGRKQNIIINTRLPNGSFSAIDSSQLIVDGNAELTCSTGTTPWKTVNGFDKILVVNQSTEENMLITGNCVFKCYHNSRAWQHVDLQRFSLLIDSGQAWYNLSTRLGCLSSNEKDHAFIRVEYATEEDIDVTSIQIESNIRQQPFHFQQKTEHIPIGIRELYINIGANMELMNATNKDELYCLIDDISLFIFKKEK